MPIDLFTMTVVSDNPYCAVQYLIAYGDDLISRVLPHVTDDGILIPRHNFAPWVHAMWPRDPIAVLNIIAHLKCAVREGKEVHHAVYGIRVPIAKRDQLRVLRDAINTMFVPMGVRIDASGPVKVFPCEFTLGSNRLTMFDIHSEWHSLLF